VLTLVVGVERASARSFRMRVRSDPSIVGSFLEDGVYPVVEHPFATPTRIDEMCGITFTEQKYIMEDGRRNDDDRGGDRGGDWNDGGWWGGGGIDSKMKEYSKARDEYNVLLKSIYAETDTAKQAKLINKLADENKKLKSIAQSLLDAWNKLSRNDRTNRSIRDLEDDLVQYRQDVQSFQGANDERTRLAMMHTDLNQGVVVDRALYFVHIVVVLILLIFTFVMFVMRGVSSGVSSAVDAVAEPISSMVTE